MHSVLTRESQEMASTHQYRSPSTTRARGQAGVGAKSATGETLTAAKVDGVNTVDAPNTVVPQPLSAKAAGGKLSLKLEPKSVTVVSVEQ